MAKTLTGLAASWERDLGDDIIEPGAFDAWLRSWKSGGEVVPLVDSHSYHSIDNVVGVLTEAKETNAGLETVFRMADTDRADTAFSLAKSRMITGLSIGYLPIEWDFEEDAAALGGKSRHITQIDLREVSVCLFPMNPFARIASVSGGKAAVIRTEVWDPRPFTESMRVLKERERTRPFPLYKEQALAFKLKILDLRRAANVH